MSSRLFTILEAPPTAPHLIWRFGIAIGSAAIALIFSHLLISPLGVAGAYLPVLGALVVSAWYGGVGPALLTQIVSALVVFLLITRPQPFGFFSNIDLYSLLGFLVVGKLLLFWTANLRWNAHLRQNKQDLEMITRATHDSLWEWDVVSNKIRHNGNTRQIFGGSRGDSPRTIDAWRERLHSEDAERVWSNLSRVLESGDNAWEDEYRIRRTDGSYVVVSDRGLIVRNKAGKPTRMIGGIADVSAQKRAEDQLIHNASHDALTGLPNRELFLAGMQRAIASRQHGEGKTHGYKTLAVLFLDIDRFKVINDSLGHALGDDLLAAVAARLKQSLRPEDMAARIGGNEFALMLNGLEDSSAAARSAERIQELLATPFDLDEHHVILTASIGIACAGRSDTPEDILSHADIAMYRAKTSGKANYTIFEPAFDRPAKDVLQLETDLRQALQQQRFHLYYQPIVSLQTGRIASFEALLRWEHPRRGLLLPADFLSIAEEAGLSIPISDWTLRESCRCLAAWHQSVKAAQHLSISVNLSEKQFIQPAVIDQVRETLQESGLDGRFLTLELTETMMMENSELTLSKLGQLRDLGVRLAIDDFGKGYSSLGRLQDFAISILKIDASFVKRIGAGSPEIVDAIIALAHQLNLEVTAEGIETEQQLFHLAEAGCSMGQGFFFSNALRREAVEAMLWRDPQWATGGAVAHTNVRSVAK